MNLFGEIWLNPIEKGHENYMQNIKANKLMLEQMLKDRKEALEIVKRDSKNLDPGVNKHFEELIEKFENNIAEIKEAYDELLVKYAEEIKEIESEDEEKIN